MEEQVRHWPKPALDIGSLKQALLDSFKPPSPIAPIAGIVAFFLSILFLENSSFTNEGKAIIAITIALVFFFFHIFGLTPFSILGSISMAIILVTLNDVKLSLFVFSLTVLVEVWQMIKTRKLLESKFDEHCKKRKIVSRKKLNENITRRAQNKIEEIISQNAGKVLLQVYLIWKKECNMPTLGKLSEVTKLSEPQLKRALKYSKEKEFLDLDIRIINTGDIECFLIKSITAAGIDIIEKPEDEEGNRPFNIIFNFNNEFKIDSIIKGEAKLF